MDEAKRVLIRTSGEIIFDFTAEEELVLSNEQIEKIKEVMNDDNIKRLIVDTLNDELDLEIDVDYIETKVEIIER